MKEKYVEFENKLWTRTFIFTLTMSFFVSMVLNKQLSAIRYTQNIQVVTILLQEQLQLYYIGSHFIQTLYWELIRLKGKKNNSHCRDYNNFTFLIHLQFCLYSWNIICYKISTWCWLQCSINCNKYNCFHYIYWGAVVCGVTSLIAYVVLLHNKQLSSSNSTSCKLVKESI